MIYGVCLFFSNTWQGAGLEIPSFIPLLSLSYQLESSGCLGPSHTLLTFFACFLYSYPASQIHATISGSTFDTLVIFSSLFNWAIHFYFSAQVPELGDTLFIVFRKQQLIFLHWYVSSTKILGN
jgi:hypothetical protein